VASETVRFYAEKSSRLSTDMKRIYASTGRNKNKSYYSFYPDRIVKTMESTKNLIYTVFYGEISANYNSAIFQKLSSLDSLVLSNGDRLLDSLGLKFKKAAGATGYEIEVNYYHGYPRKKKFKP
jgi:hypothetical protein